MHEFETGGGRSGAARTGAGARGAGGLSAPSSLALEGAAMRAALVADLVASPGVNEVRVTWDHLVAVRLPPALRRMPPEVRRVPPIRGVDRTLEAALADVDAVWLIAPETGGVLHRLAHAVEHRGRGLVGPNAAATRRAADKGRLARRLARAGIPGPATVRVNSAGPGALGGRDGVGEREFVGREAGAGRGAVLPTPKAAAGIVGYPLVVKPAVGAGAVGAGLARSPAELGRAVASARAVAQGSILVQRYVEGVAVSVSLACNGRRAVPLAAHAQRVRVGSGFSYEGGETPLRHPLAERAVECAVAACQAVPGLRGYVGVDLVLTAAEALVLEINPRLTTSYLGVRSALDVNPAALALAAWSGELPSARPAVRRPVRFGADGALEWLEELACSRS